MILKILKTLESDNSRLFKEKILTDNKDNPLLQRVLKSALDTHTQYYQRKIPEYTYSDADQMSLPWALGQLETLSKREVTGNEAIDRLSNVLGSISEDDAQVIERVISKDLKCGVSISTVNKIFGKGFISTYPCMLASPMSSMKNVTYPALVQTKMDGMRANIIIDAEGNVDVRSRNGKQIYLSEHFQTYVMGIFYKSATLENLDLFHGAVLDGELIVLNEAGEILDRKTGNGILNKAVKGTITPEEASRVRMWCWDMIPLDDFWKGICKIPYFDRVSVLTERMNTVYNAQEEHLINVLSATPVDNQEQAERIFQIALDDGQEGIIIKNGDSPWEDKRSKFQVKMKAELEIDLLVTDVLEGKGKAEGLIGSLSCKSKDGNLLVNVGSGLNDEDRKKDPEEFIGKIISVKYNEKIKDKKSDSWSLFLPIFQELRLDKSEADNL